MGLTTLIYALYYHGIYLRFRRAYLCFFSNHRQELDLSTQTVLITGAASGIGRQLALDLLTLPKEHRPKKLILWDLNQCPDFQDGVPQAGVQIICRRFDVCNYALTNQYINNDGHVDVAVCNAGIAGYGTLDKLSWDAYYKTINVNFLAKVQMTKTLLELYPIKSLVYISSMASYGGIATMSEYCPSKAAIRSFAESLQGELALRKKNCHVATICPYFASTGITKPVEHKMKGRSFMWTTTEHISHSIQKALCYPEIDCICVGWMAMVTYVMLQCFTPRFFVKNSTSIGKKSS